MAYARLSPERANLINVAGRQRMLSQRLSKAGLHLAASVAHEDYVNAKLYSSEIQETCLEWLENHSWLQLQALASGANEGAIQEKLDSRIDRSIREATVAAKALVDAGNAPEPSAREVMAAAQNLEVKVESMLPGLEAVVVRHASRAEEALERLYLIGYIGIAVLIAALVSVSVFFFEPTIRRLDQRTRKLAESEGRQTRAIAGSNDGIWDYDPASGWTWYSDRFLELLGFPAAEMVNVRPELDFFIDRLHPEDRGPTLAAVNAHLERDDPYDVRYRMRTWNGSYRWFRARGLALRDDAGEPIRMAGSIQDIEDLVAAEVGLRESNQLLANIIETIPFYVFWKDRESRYLGCNRAFAEAVGLATPDAVKGLSDSDLPWTPCVNQGTSSDEYVMQAGVPALGVESVHGRRDGERVFLRSSKVPLHNSMGQVVGLVGSCVDLTERRQLEEQLARAQKLESIGQLAAGIAHEINTPTQFIGDNTRFLDDSFRDIAPALKHAASIAAKLGREDRTKELASELTAALEDADITYLCEEIPRAIQQSLEGIERVRTIVQSMKEFSHPGSPSMEAVDLNRTIENTITVARNEWKYVATMETDLADDLPLVPGIVGELNQVILNIIVNAAHAIADAAEEHQLGTIRIASRCVDEFAEIRISDTGGGIPENIQKRIFDPFFTTKEVGRGTGQGLAIAHSMITGKHDGQLEFETTPGEGTTFIIRLPLERRPSRPKHASTAALG